MRCPLVRGEMETRYLLRTGHGPTQASADCTTNTCQPIVQDLATLVVHPAVCAPAPCLLCERWPLPVSLGPCKVHWLVPMPK